MNEFIIYTDSYDFDDRTEFGTVLVFFYDHSDALSRAFESIIEEIAAQYADRINVLAVDIEQSPDLAYRYSIEVLPAVVVLHNNEIIEQIEGSNNPSVYTDIIDELI